MLRFLSGFQLDQPSFWFGFLAGILTGWLLTRSLPAAKTIRNSISSRLRATQQELFLNIEIRHANDTLRHAQRLHLAASLFSLDEILIPPRLLAPPLPVEPNLPPPYSDITGRVLPYLPDWPELAAVFQAPVLTLAEALQGDANLAIIGRPGSGKSVALSHLASQIARCDPQYAHLTSSVPVLVHAANLNLPSGSSPDLLASLIDALTNQASPSTSPRLPGYIQTALENRRALLILDGLDELPPAEFGQTVQFLNRLLQKYPGNRAVVSASSDYFNGLASIGFIPICIAAWDPQQQAAFTKQWGELWTRWFASGSPSIDPVLLNGWLSTGARNLTPLELTLKVWSACAGDSHGPGIINDIEAYLRRTTGLPVHSDSRLALQHLASEMVLSMQPVISFKDAEQYLSNYKLPLLSIDEESTAGTASPFTQPAASKAGQSASRLLPGLVKKELIISRSGSRLSFCHPVFLAYLAGQAIAGRAASQPDCINKLLDQPEWTGSSLVLHFLAALDHSAGWVGSVLAEAEADVLIRPLFKSARWLRDAPESAPWRAGLLRRLAGCLRNRSLSLGIRARALAGLLLSGSQGVSALLRQSLNSKDAHLCQLASLGCGFLRDIKAVKDMSILLNDRLPPVRDAASLGLVAVGDQDALEAVASALLNGDESLRQSAAEALSNHLEEGYPVLKEGSSLDDVLVRRAVIHGLVRVRQPWAIDLLQKMCADSQWVVQSAASQALETIANLNSPASGRIPHRLPPLTETPWMIAFAGKYGIGVAPGKPAIDLLQQALKDGTEEERLAALHILSRELIESAIPLLYEIYDSNEGDLREAALNTLWHYAAAGMHLPPV